MQGLQVDRKYKDLQPTIDKKGPLQQNDPL